MPPWIIPPGAKLLLQCSGPVCRNLEPDPAHVLGHFTHPYTPGPTPPHPSRRLHTLGVAVAGQAAALIPLAEEALLAALAVGSLRVAQAAKAAVAVPCLPQEVPVEDTLPGHPIAVTHWGEERDFKRCSRVEGTSYEAVNPWP